MLLLIDLMIYQNEDLKSALQRMTENHRGILFVCDEYQHLVGIVTDGDIRRALLNGSLMLTPLRKTMNTDPITGKDAAEATALLKQFSAIAVPIVDEQGVITGAVVLEEYGAVAVLLPKTDCAIQSVAPDKDEIGAVAIVPARGNSKRIPKKNLAIVASKPLITWAVLAAKEAQHIRYVIGSTDDPQIAEEFRLAGAMVPWLRPAELATDNASSLAVVIHALNWCLAVLEPKPVFAVLLEPTAPLRLGTHIDQALELLVDRRADSVVSVSELPHTLNPEEVLVVRDGQLQPYIESRTVDTRKLRGQQSPAYVQNGLVYAFNIQSVLQQQSLYGKKCIPLVTRWSDFLDVDEPEDLLWADFKKRQQLTSNK